MDRRWGLIGAVLLCVVVAVAWWPGAPDVPPSVEVESTLAPLAEVPSSPPTEPRLEPPSAGASAVDALERLAAVEGALRLQCPDPGFPIGEGPFLRAIQLGGALEVLVSEPSGTGLVRQALVPGRPATRAPSATMTWDVEGPLCRFDPVVWAPVHGVVEAEDGPVAPSWVVGCGVAMHPVDEGGRFVVEAPEGVPCQLQAEGRGDGVWVVPNADAEVDVVVPWVSREGTEREEVAARFRAELDALDALELQPDPLDEALDDVALPPGVREVLEGWRDDETRLREGRRRWLEQALRRYEAPPPAMDDMDAPDVWNLDGATR